MASANRFARIFSRERPLSARGKILYFATMMDTETQPTSPKTNNFSAFSHGLEFLNEAEKEKNEKETRHQRRHDSLHCPKDTLEKPNKFNKLVGFNL